MATVGEQIEGQGHDWDEETLSSEEEGLVYFDGAYGSPIWQELLYCAMLCCAVLCFMSCHFMQLWLSGICFSANNWAPHMSILIRLG